MTEMKSILVPCEPGEVSDGYHTFNELYEHRHLLFILVANQLTTAWKSRLHDDGASYDGWFIAGIQLPTGDISYHLPLNKWNICKCKTLEKAPKWDGHTSQDVLERLKQLIIEL
jgi:hypothetical protein